VRGNAFVRQASERRFLSAFSSCHLDIISRRNPMERCILP
jgi:hypothetical protein